MKCKKCGAEFPEGIFCPECGERVITEEQTSRIENANEHKSGSVGSSQGQSGTEKVSQRNGKPTPKKQTNGFLVVLLLAIIAIVAIVLILRPNKPTSSNNQEPLDEKMTAKTEKGTQEDDYSETEQSIPADDTAGNGMNSEEEEKEKTTTDVKMESIDNSYNDIVEKAREYSGAPEAALDQVLDDGTIVIRLYEDMGDHTSSWDWYTIDPHTLCGTDFNGNPIDLNSVDANSNNSHQINNTFEGDIGDMTHLYNSDDLNIRVGEPLFAIVTAPDEYVNVRTGPGTDNDIVATIANGIELEIIDKSTRDNGKIWLRIASNAPFEFDEGWVAESQITYLTEGYVVPYSDSLFYSEDDLKGLSHTGLRFARNEIYARHGYIFSDTSLNGFFRNRSWYNPQSKDSIPDSQLNEYEIHNRDLIKQLEDMNQ